MYIVYTRSLFLTFRFRLLKHRDPGTRNVYLKRRDASRILPTATTTTLLHIVIVLGNNNNNNNNNNINLRECFTADVSLITYLALSSYS